MASVSYGLNRGEDQNPDTIHVGTQAVSTYDVELRMDKTKNLNRDDVILILKAYIRRLENKGEADIALAGGGTV